jgi:hypothetical protein
VDLALSCPSLVRRCGGLLDDVRGHGVEGIVGMCLLGGGIGVVAALSPGTLFPFLYSSYARFCSGFGIGSKGTCTGVSRAVCLFRCRA